jgi:hypothetical protein
VNAEVKNTAVGDKPVLRVKRLKAALTAKSPQTSGEPYIRLDDDTVIEGVTIGRYALIVELNKTLFQRYDTHSKLRAAVDDKKFVREHGDSMLINTPFDGPVVSPVGELVQSSGYIYATIVKRLRWAGKPYPGAEIECHTVKVPDFGRIFFGEIFIGKKWRRLTMMRLKLGSPMGGDMACAEIDANGGWG